LGAVLSLEGLIRQIAEREKLSEQIDSITIKRLLRQQQEKIPANLIFGETMKAEAKGIKRGSIA
jgi:hypothetical protein